MYVTPHSVCVGPASKHRAFCTFHKCSTSTATQPCVNRHSHEISALLHFYVLIILTNCKYSVNRILALFHVFWFLNICHYQKLISDSNIAKAFFLSVFHHLKCVFCVSIPFKTTPAELPWTHFLSPSSYHPNYLIFRWGLCTCVLQF